MPALCATSLVGDATTLGDECRPFARRNWPVFRWPRVLQISKFGHSEGGRRVSSTLPSRPFVDPRGIRNTVAGDSSVAGAIKIPRAHVVRCHSGFRLRPRLLAVDLRKSPTQKYRVTTYSQGNVGSEATRACWPVRVVNHHFVLRPILIINALSIFAMVSGDRVPNTLRNRC